MPILPKSLTVNHSAEDCPDSINLERVQFLAPLTVQFLQVQKLEYTQHASVRSGKLSLWGARAWEDSGQRGLGTGLQACLANPMRLSPPLSCVLLVGPGDRFPRAAQTASGEYHGVCTPCPLCLWSGLASADTGNKTQLYWWISPVLILREFH